MSRFGLDCVSHGPPYHKRISVGSPTHWGYTQNGAEKLLLHDSTTHAELVDNVIGAIPSHDG